MSDRTKSQDTHFFKEQKLPLEDRLAYAEHEIKRKEKYEQKLHQKISKLLEKVDALERLNSDLTHKTKEVKLPILGVVNTNDEEFICR